MARRRRTPRLEPLRFGFEPPAAAPHRPPRRRRMRWARTLFVALLIALLGIVSAFFGFMTAIAQMKPILPPYVAPQQIGHIYAIAGATRDGKPIWKEIATLRSPEARVPVEGKQISQSMRDAIVAIEDRRFYEHHGFDPEGMARAIFKRVVLGTTEGGSTITQQLVKNAYLSPQQTVRRKVQEVLLAYQLERQWHSKAKILDAYLNRSYFGNGCYGVEAAAEYYFGAHASALKPNQAAVIAAIVKSLTAFDSLLHPAAALERRNIVIDKMAEQKLIAPLDAAIAKQQPLLPKLNRRRVGATSTVAPYFAAYVEEQLVNRYGATTTYGGGLRVYTTLDLREQNLAERTARKDIRSTGLSTAIVSIDPATSYVKAMVGGWDYRKSQFNIATQGHRQPGSSFKPFVFLAALKKGIRPATRFNSHKVVLPNGTTQGWYVKNDTPFYEGYKPLDYALAKSDNTIFAQLTLAVGPQPVADAAHAAGINSPLNPNLSIGLGGLSLGVTPLEMAHAYATIANEGERVGGSILFHTPDAGITQSDAEPISILSVVHPGGRTDVNAPLPRQVVSRTDALTLIDAMRGVIRFGTGTKAALPRRTVIGKTGTTSNFLDAWFIGAVQQRVAAVWVGYPDVARPMLTEYHGHEVLGGTYPAIVWHDFMAAVAQHMPARDWPHAPFVPDESVIVDRATGKRAPAGCNNTQELIVALDKVPGTESSCRATPFTVPDLSGLGEKQAAQQVFDNGLVFVPDLQPAQPGQHAGSVIDQTPDPYTRVGNKTPVHVTIAVAAPQVYVPAASSRKSHRITIAEAIGRLRTAHFRIALIGNSERSDLPDGTVVHQEPVADTLAPQGTVVTLEVVGNVDALVVPDVSGMRVADAELALRADGLTVASARRAVGGRALPTDWVITTNWTPGIAVPPGTSISLTTSRRPL